MSTILSYRNHLHLSIKVATIAIDCNSPRFAELSADMVPQDAVCEWQTGA